jgi:hypothetical protein
MQPEQESLPRRHLLIVGLFGFGLYMALGAIAFRMLTDPLFMTSKLALTGGEISSAVQTYIILFDLYFFIMAALGLSVYRYAPTKGGKALILVLMLVPGIVVLFTLQVVYLVSHIRGFLAMAPAIAIVYVIDKMDETTNYPEGKKPLTKRPLPWHLIGVFAMINVFELSLDFKWLAGGLVVWAIAFVLALLLLRQVYGIRNKMMVEAAILDDQRGVEERNRVFGRFKTACAVVFVIMILPLYTLVMEPGAEIGDANAQMSGDEVGISLTVVNRYARPIEGKIQVIADIGVSTYLVDERDGLGAFSTWKTGTSLHDAGAGGMTCHLRVVVAGRQTDSVDTVIKSECDVIWTALGMIALGAVVSSARRRKPRES